MSIEPEVSTMMISAASPRPGLPGSTRIGACHRHHGMHVGGSLCKELVLEHLCLELSHVTSLLASSVAMGHSEPGRR